MISTKGRYALRVMLDLAEHSNENLIPMKEVAKRQNISLKYLEKILPPLAKNNFIIGVHGKGGGYKLAKDAKDYKVLDILKITEGDLAPVACLSCNKEVCDNANECKTRPMWLKLYSMINNYFDSITLEDLINDSSILDDEK